MKEGERRSEDPVTFILNVPPVIEGKARQLAKSSNLSLSEFFTKIILEEGTRENEK